MACTAAPKTTLKQKSQLIKLLWVAPAVLSNAMLLLFSKTEMTKSSLRWGCGIFLPAHTNKTDVCDYLEAAARSIFTVDIDKSPHLLSLITKQARPMSSCFSLPALSCKVLLST